MELGGTTFLSKISATSPRTPAFLKPGSCRGSQLDLPGNGQFMISVMGTIAKLCFRAVIKITSGQSGSEMLKRVHECYQNPAVQSSWHLRALYDAIDVHGPAATSASYCLAFEWMDCTLKDLSFKAHGQSRVLHKSISKAVLEALDVLKSQHLVHTGMHH